MNVYRDKDGKWVGTQAEAGNKDVIELPTISKPQMLEWLNANCIDNPSGDVPTPVSSDNYSTTPDGLLGKCPKCRMTPAAAEKAAAGIAVEAVGKRIATAPQWEAIRLMESVLWRCTEIQNELGRAKENESLPA